MALSNGQKTILAGRCFLRVTKHGLFQQSKTMESEDREDIIRAKKAISPDGLENQSAEGHSGVGSEQPVADLPGDDLSNHELEDKYTDEAGEPAENVRTMNPNRNPNDKPDIDKPAYS